MADSKPKTTKKRLVKNPETFRERALKSNADNASKSKKYSSSRKVASSIFRPIENALRSISEIKALSFLKRPLRILGKILLPVYLRNSWRELTKVTWPSWKQSRQLTYAVLIFAVIFGATIAVVDYGLDKLFRNILLK